jgi:L-ascorbate metabolism protein UlaG (beta-lactamase superfamily)
MKLIDRIYWFGQASVKIETNGSIIYFDPYKIKSKDKADVVFITHSHFDHLSMDDLKKVADSQTPVVAPSDCLGKLKDAGYTNITEVAPGGTGSVLNFYYEAVPAYNVVKTKFHPKSNNWVGYVVEVEGRKIYLAGDTERIPEMKTIACDIALLPLGQTFTMNRVEDAVEAAKDVKATIVIPIHYGLYEGTKADAIRFKDLLKGKAEVVLK